MKVVIVIPARQASSRFPNKPLELISGKSLLSRTWSIAQAVASKNPKVEVVVATDSEEIRDHAAQFGARVVLSSVACKNGSERAFAALTQLQLKPDVVINLQGDAVLTPPWVIEDLIQAMQPSKTQEHEPVVMATPAVRFTWRSFDDYKKGKAQGRTSGTLVVFDRSHKALYFSKGIIPHLKSGGVLSARADQSTSDCPYFRHIGTYAFQYETLKAFCELAPGPLEATEDLEQLRALENNIPIKIVEVDYKGRTHWSVDHSEDVTIVESIIAKEGELLA